MISSSIPIRILNTEKKLGKQVGKSGTKFPISMKVVEKLSKDANINLYITRLLDYLYTEEFMAKTKVTSKRNKSASPSEEGQLD
ncbi:Uncharacterized protein APZ42_010294 [Daphnia magna]|uniref:Uncharacterized protein n=1 Tax=Daphnia magna TaxID=35525 RepID=A0A164DGP2_9CRUS|nr:Uncharacterized protein APZ42_010294 [Daphnia magna]